jgi:hypothetical protein
VDRVEGLELAGERVEQVERGGHCAVGLSAMSARSSRTNQPGSFVNLHARLAAWYLTSMRRLAVVLPLLVGSMANAVPTNTTQLRYPDLAASAIGDGYRARIQADRGVQDIPVLVLSLTHRGRTQNLLEPSGNWHGTEPFTFLVSDFAHRESAIYSPSRRLLQVAGTDQLLEVRVVEANVGPQGSWKDGRLGLSLSLRPASRQD